MSKAHLAFCPICNKGRKNPLPNSVLSPTGVKDIVRCNCCKRLFIGDKEVIVDIKEKPEPGQDLRKMIPDWYRCPECREVVVGYASWAAHCWQKHKMRQHEFEKKYGEPEKSYYGIDFGEYFNPSER